MQPANYLISQRKNTTQLHVHMLQISSMIHFLWKITLWYGKWLLVFTFFLNSMTKDATFKGHEVTSI